MADNTIDTLSLEIKSNASSAEKSIEKLAESLGKLSKSVGSVNTNGIKSFANSMDVLTRSMLGIKNVNASQFTKVAKGISKFEDIDTGKIAAVSNSIKPLAQSINTLNGLTFDGKNISSFIRSIAALSSANVGNLNNVDFIGLANSIKSLTNGLAGAPDVSRNTISITNAIARLGASGDKIGKVTEQLPGFSRAMHSMINSMSGAKSVNSDILEFTRAIGSLANAGKKTETTAQNLDNLAEALKRFFRTMSMAPEVKGNIIQMTQALAQLSSSGSKVRSATTGLTSSLQGFSGISSKTRKHTFSLASAFGKFYASCWLVIRAVGLLKKSIDISSDLTEIQNVVDVTFGNMTSKVEEFSKNSIQNFGMSELTTKKIASRFQAMGTAMGINQSLISNANTYLNKQTKGYVGMSDSMADVSLNLTKLTADMASFYNVEQDVVAEDLESVFTGATRPLREYGLDLTQATLQEWAMKQGLDANIDSMSQAEKTMLRYQYVLANTGAAQNDFQRTSVTWANQLRILVENFRQLGSVIGKTLIGALKPLITALNIAMSHIIAFAETVSNALGKIFGWKYESGGGGGGIAQDLETGAGAADDIAGGMENAADAAKKLKTHLLGIDELNVVEPDVGNTGGSGGTGGAGGAGGGASGGQWVKGESILEDFKSEIDTLFELGNYIRDTLIKMMESIKWDEVYEKTRGFGKGLAEFLNGLLDYDGEGRTLFGEVGRTFANTLNSIVYSAQSFATTFDFEQLGVNIADGINNIFENFDFGSLANAIDSWVKGLWKTLKTAVLKIKWKNIFKGIFDFLDEIDLGTMFLISIPSATKLYKILEKLSLRIKSLAKYSMALVGTFIGNSNAVSVLSEKFPTLSKVVDVLGSSFQKLMFGIHYGDLSGGINYALENIRNNLTGMQKGVISAIAAFVEFKAVSDTMENLKIGSEGLVSGIAKIGTSVASVGVALTTTFGFPAGVFATAIIGIIGAFKGISDAEKKLVENSEIEKYGDTISNLVKNINEASDAAKERAENSLNYVNTVGVAELQMTSDLVDQYFDLAEKENLTNAEKEKMKNLASTLVETMPSLQQYYSEETGLIDATRESIEKLVESRLKEIKLAAIEEELKQAYVDQANQLKVLEDAVSVANDQQKIMNGLNKEYQEILAKNDAYSEWVAISQQIDEGTGNTEELLQKQKELWNLLTNNGIESFPTFDTLSTELLESEANIESFSLKYNEAMGSLANAEEAYSAVESNISNLTKMLTDGMTSAAEDSSKGYSNALKNDVSMKETTLEKAKDLLEAFRSKDGIDSHSPSRAFERSGKDSIDGFILGLNKNEKNLISTVFRLSEKLLNTLRKIIAPMREIGKNAMDGLYDGLSSMEGKLYAKAKNIADNITKTIKKALEIHSPSRVMFEIGSYSMQGLKNGLESLYNPIVNSLKDLSYDIQIAPIPNTFNYPSYEPFMEFEKVNYEKSILQESFNSDQTNSNALLMEQNELLRQQNELLSYISDKEIVARIDPDREMIQGFRNAEKRLGFSFT